ncbi:MAG: ATP-binding protein [Spirochaetaceae bacterium]
MRSDLNTRILVIDDEEAIRASFAEILAPRRRDSGKLSSLSRQLFGEERGLPKRSSLFDFEVDLAGSGEEGLKCVIASVENGSPYAAIFVDVRMPGLDGLETVQEIRKHDSRAEIIFITAYSDYEIDEIVQRAGANVGYHTKPFAPEEIRQLATKAVYEWNKNLSLEELISLVSELRTTERELGVLLKNILHQVAELLGSSSALIASREKDRYERLIGMGLLSDEERAQAVLRRMPKITDSGVFHDEEAIYYGLARFGVVALFEGDGGALTNHRIYLARLFLEEAAQAIRNAELREELLRKEKLSAVGQGVSMVAHDLRSPLGNILSLVELLEEDGSISRESRDLIALIESSAKNAADIVHDILDFARGGGLKKVETTTGEILELVEREARRTVSERAVELRMVDAAERGIRCDRSKVARALLNLIRNSAEALSRETGIEERRIEVRCESADGELLYRVSDNGPGLPGVVRDNLFVPFVSAGSGGRQKRTGLGLAIVKQFVDLHGGRIEVETNERGTTFTIGIPG